MDHLERLAEQIDTILSRWRQQEIDADEAFDEIKNAHRDFKAQSPQPNIAIAIGNDY